MVPFLMTLISCDANNSFNVAPHFDYLDQTNAVVPLIMQLSSHDADDDANGIT